MKSHFNCQNCQGAIADSIFSDDLAIFPNAVASVVSIFCTHCDQENFFEVSESSFIPLNGVAMNLQPIQIISVDPDWKIKPVGPAHDLLFLDNKMGWCINAGPAYALLSNVKGESYPGSFATWILNLPYALRNMSRLAAAIESALNRPAMGEDEIVLRPRFFASFLLWNEQGQGRVLKNFGVPSFEFDLSMLKPDLTLSTLPKAQLTEVATRSRLLSAIAKNAYHQRELDQDWLQTDLPAVLGAMQNLLTGLAPSH